MRIGSEDNFLIIQALPVEGGFSTWRVEAACGFLAGRFRAVHDRILPSSAPEDLLRLRDFEALLLADFEIHLTEGGSLRVHRDGRGYLTVSYRLASRRASAAMEGEVPVDAEFAGDFCHQMRLLLSATM